MRGAAAGVLLLLFGAGVARAQPVPCPAPGPVQVTLQVDEAEPRVLTDLGVRGLHAETGQPMSPQRHHLGLTTLRLAWRSAIEVRAQDSPGGACVVPQRILLVLVQHEHLIRIAREIPRDSCLFREVEEHERRHVAVNRTTIRQGAEQARRAAAAWAPRAEARGANVAAATAALQQSLWRAVEPTIAAMRAAQAGQHAMIDTQAEYRRLANVCPDDHRVVQSRLMQPDR